MYREKLNLSNKIQGACFYLSGAMANGALGEMPVVYPANSIESMPITYRSLDGSVEINDYESLFTSLGSNEKAIASRIALILRRLEIKSDQPTLSEAETLRRAKVLICISPTILTNLCAKGQKIAEHMDLVLQDYETRYHDNHPQYKI